ncbi:hypothetical protein TDB9533_03745 [Thalassocella blandensis]|nr:hypothetical protein TDB9533_03745 [Thalassocella blandensis]
MVVLKYLPSLIRHRQQAASVISHDITPSTAGVCRFIAGLLISLTASTEVYSQSAQTHDWGMSVTASTQQQNYENSDASFRYLQFTPTLVWHNWDFNINLSYLDIEGNYFNNGAFPRYQEYCSRVLGMGDRLRDYLVSNGRLNEEQVINCQESAATQDSYEESASGLGDISFGLRYNWEILSTANPSLAYISVDISLDNGDYEKGLGSGSQDVMTEIGWMIGMGNWTHQASAGYVLVDQTDALEQVGDYAYLNLSTNYSIHPDFMLGASYSVEQAYEDELEDIGIVSINGIWYFTDALSASGYYSQYLETEYYPENELGLSLSLQF